MKWQVPRPRLRTKSLLVLIAFFALGLAALHAYLRPDRVWRRAIHQTNPTRRVEAWGQARSGRIEGLSPKQTVVEVTKILEDADDEAVAQAVEVLPFIQGDPAEVARLLSLRLQDADPKVRRTAADAIRYAVQPDSAGREVAFPRLVAALDDPDPGVRRRAARSLGEISFHAGHSESFDPTQALARRLQDSSDAVRAAAALAMARDGGGEEAVSTLLAMLDEHLQEKCPKAECSVVFEALMVLAPRSDRATTGLIGKVYSEKEGRSEEALTTLSAIVQGDYPARRRVVARSLQALKGKDADLKLAACLTLIRMGEGRTAIPGLLETYEQASSRARSQAQTSIERLTRTDPEGVRQGSDKLALGPRSRELLQSLMPGVPGP